MNETLLTKVFARTLSSISLRSSIASVTDVTVDHPVYAPTLVKLPSVGTPNGIVLPTTEILFAAAKAALAVLRANESIAEPPVTVLAAAKAALA